MYNYSKEGDILNMISTYPDVYASVEQVLDGQQDMLVTFRVVALEVDFSKRPGTLAIHLSQDIFYFRDIPGMNAKPDFC